MTPHVYISHSVTLRILGNLRLATSLSQAHSGKATDIYDCYRVLSPYLLSQNLYFNGKFLVRTIMISCSKIPEAFLVCVSGEVSLIQVDPVGHVPEVYLSSQWA